MMIQISKMNLKWCFLIAFNKSKHYKTTGWIANNYLAFARLMLIFYRYIRSVIPSTEPGLLQCEGMIQSAVCLISYIMSKHNNDPKPLQEYTKLFLSCVDKFEAAIYVANGAIPVWKSRGNFLSLLNLPLQQEYFGNVRLFWEGERERYIQQIKPLLTQLRHSTSFLVTKLERLYQLSAIDYVLQSLPQGPLSNQFVKTYDRHFDFIIYSNIDTVNKKLSDLEPISGISIMTIDDEECYYVIVKNIRKSLKLYKLQFKESGGRIKCAHYYRGINLVKKDSNEIQIYNSKIHLQQDIEHFLLLLPDLERKENREYTIVSNEWTYLKTDMNLGFCTIQNNLFREL